jgi:hypothetical protein
MEVMRRQAYRISPPSNKTDVILRAPLIDPLAVQIGGAIALSALIYRSFERPAPDYGKKPRQPWPEFSLALAAKS